MLCMPTFSLLIMRQKTDMLCHTYLCWPADKTYRVSRWCSSLSYRHAYWLSIDQTAAEVARVCYWCWVSTWGCFVTTYFLESLPSQCHYSNKRTNKVREVKRGKIWRRGELRWSPFGRWSCHHHKNWISPINKVALRVPNDSLFLALKELTWHSTTTTLHANSLPLSVLKTTKSWTHSNPDWSYAVGGAQRLFHCPISRPIPVPCFGAKNLKVRNQHSKPKDIKGHFKRSRNIVEQTLQEVIKEKDNRGAKRMWLNLHQVK